MNTNLEEQVRFFNLFKETARNNIGIIHGFPNWVNKMSFVIENDDLLIKIPPALIIRGGYEKISRSRRKKEIDFFMRKKEYNYLEFVIKTTCSLYASIKEKKLATVAGFYKKGNGK